MRWNNKSSFQQPAINYSNEFALPEVLSRLLRYISNKIQCIAFVTKHSCSDYNSTSKCFGIIEKERDGGRNKNYWNIRFG